MTAPRIWTLADLDAQPEPAWLVEGVIPEQGDGMIFGATGSGKSFLSLDLGLTLASGMSSWFGRRIPFGGPVVYVATEGAYALKNRVQAWRRMHPTAAPCFYVVPDAVTLTNREDVDGLVTAVSGMIEERVGVAMIFIDTLSRATPGIDENDRGAMGVALEAVSRLRQLWGCAVALVHHPGHDETRPRGSSSLLQAMDWSIQVATSDGNRVMKCAKLRDGEPFAPIGFRLTALAPSMIVEPAEAVEVLNEKGDQALTTLRRLGGGPVSAIYWRSESGLKERTFFTYLNKLVARGAVVKSSKGYQLPTAEELPTTAAAVRVGTAAAATPFRVAGSSNPGIRMNGLGDEEEIEREAIALEGQAG